MKKINIKGVIVSDDEKWIYDWFGIECTSPKSVNKVIEEANGDDIEVIINSGGGDVFAGSEIFTLLKDYPGHLVGKIVGIAASAAGVVAMGVKKLLISPTAQFMMHNTSNISKGDYRVHQKSSDFLKNWNDSIANAYMLKSGMSKEELLELMNQETWLTAQQALEKKLVDEIMFDDGNQPKLVAGINNFQMIPQQVIDKVRNEFGLINIKPNSLINFNKKEEGKLDLEKIKNEHPELYAQIKNEGHEEGVQAERNRIKAIDELAMPGNDDIITKAKFETGISAEQVAVEIIKAEKKRGTNFLDNRNDDAKDLEKVDGSAAPQNDDAAEKEKTVNCMVNAANNMRGVNK